MLEVLLQDTLDILKAMLQLILIKKLQSINIMAFGKHCMFG